MKVKNIIIGFGKAGKTLGGFLASKGEEVTLIERDPAMYGGTCINVGCIPSKSLINSASISSSHQEKHYEEAIEEKRRLTSFLREKNKSKLVSSGVYLVDGEASFLSDHVVVVKTKDGNLTLEGERIFINTGSASRLPPIPGLTLSSKVLTSTSLMELTTLPKRLLIIGGGYIGLEFASMYAAFGSEVTVLEGGTTFLGNEDEDVANAIKNNLLSQGIKFIYGVRIKEVKENKDSVVVSYSLADKDIKIEGEALLVATGRVPNVSPLHLENTNIALTERGAIKVNEKLETSVPNVYALGDVNGGRQHTYVSLDDFRVIKSTLYGDGSYTTNNRVNVPYSVFLATPLARVGLSEKEAKAKGIDYKVNVIPTASIPKAQVLKKTQGLLKAIVDKKSNEILGVALLAPESYEVINIVKLAMDHHLPSTSLRDMVFTHPTMAESLNDLFAF
jgi:pyruvate/2-oxoglutarate dehydrogenase complex dihydrolipoamide dehydrogenase (E3) component